MKTAAVAVALCFAAPAYAGAVFSETGHSYSLTPEPLSWQDAQVYAESVGGNLASITTASEQDWIVATFGAAVAGTDGFWIGLTDADVEGVFEWVSGEDVTFTNWGPGEPNDYPSSPTGEDFVSVDVRTVDAFWIDYPSPYYNDLPVLFYGVVEVVPAPSSAAIVLALGAWRRRRSS